MTDLSLVYPVRVVGTNVMHLARYEEPDYDDPAGVPKLVAVCPGSKRIGALELVPLDAPPFVVCPDCRSWLAEANPAALTTLLQGAKR